MTTLKEYLRRKKRELDEREKRAIRAQIDRGNADVYTLAQQYDCVPTQIAGIKAAMKR
jgi:hypothetical protein